MKFNDFPYKRPNLKTLKARFEKLISSFEHAPTAEEAAQVLKKIDALRNTFSSVATIGQIRHSIDTRDVFYANENTFYDENTPVFEALVNQFYRKLVVSKHREYLEEKFGKQLFAVALLSIKTFEPLVLNGLQEENKNASAYVQLKATAQISFQNQTYNLSSIHPLEIDSSRATRKAAAEAKWAFFQNNSNKFESIFDDLVKQRHEIAQQLGFKNFVELGYTRMLRSDYNADMVARFRKQVQTFIVPIATEIYERQRRRLGLEALQYYDEEYKFKSGNPKPKGTPEEILAAADKMYTALSSDTARFFKLMQSRELMDLVAKDGKATGGYCTFIGKYRAPYIFSNFNGTSGDIDVLTHEAGHAFQVFSSRNAPIAEYNWPTYEACEIHSMSMEFFTYPFMPLFFGEETPKYYFMHMAAALQFLPYGVAVDEFQHFVYENPEATTQQRNAQWREIERKYLPHRRYDGNEFLENGGFWQKQSHIFTTPFYYIDYTLAQICAFQFWKKSNETPKKAWSDYVRLCRAGGSLSFLKLVELADLTSPFQEGCIESVVGDIRNWLEKFDDSAF
jgi:M3 family oligoendopeptidase